MLYPDKVDDFLEEHLIPKEHYSQLYLQIRTGETTETIGELIGGVRFGNFLLNSIIESQFLRDEIINIFASAAESPNLEHWLDYCFSRIINVVYGKEIFPVNL